MNKKEYIKPSVEAIKMAATSMMAASTPKIDIEDGEGGEILSNRHRGEWGNLWADDKK